MNMKKTIGVGATFLATLLCAVPQTARATGTIRSVDIYDTGNVYSFPNVGEPLKVNDTIQIRFHMMNLQWQETVRSATDYPDEFRNPWIFVYTKLTGNESVDRLNEIASKQPRLGLWISGGLREATCVNFPLGEASDWLKDKLDNRRHYTDLVFEYTVQPGDLALPIQLANESGTGPADGKNGQYYLKFENQETGWKMVDLLTGSVTNDFAFGSANPRDDPNFAGDSLTGWEAADENRDLDLVQSGAYVQAIDFEPTYDDPDAGVWRTIAQGSTTPESGIFPSLEIPGGAAKTMNLYLWTADENVAEIVAGRGQVISNFPCLFLDGETRNVSAVRINATDTSVPFFIKATGETNETTQVFLSASPTNIVNAAGDPITNFVVRTVKVGMPEQPGVSVTVSRPSVTASADYNTAAASVDVALRGGVWPGPGNLTIPIKVTVLENPSLNIKDYVALSEVDQGGYLHWDDELTVLPNSDSALTPLWLYANRGTVDTENGLLVEVDTNRMDAAARAYFTGKFVAATVAVNRSTPAIAQELSPIGAEANTPQEVTITVSDAYGELRDPCRYTVYWSNSGNDSPAYYTTYSNLVANAGEITFSVKYTTKGDFVSRYYVVNQDGKPSSKHEVAVTVRAQKVIETSLVQSRFAENSESADPSQRATDVVTLTFGDEGFNMPNGEPAYIFFVPRSLNASNLVDCADFNIEGDPNGRWMKGYTVYQSETSVGPFRMTFYDGNSSGISMGYDIVVRTAEYWDEGEVVTAWSSKGFSFGVTNVVPAVTQVAMSGSRVTVNGGTMGPHASLGVSKTFTAKTTEPADMDLKADEEHDYSDETKAFTTEWTFDYGNGTPDVKYSYGPPSRGLAYSFTQAGTCEVTVRMRDKDMDFDRDEWGPEFTFKVIVDAKPAISLSPYSGLDTFNEDGIGRQLGRINVNLSMVPSTNITVHIDVRKAGSETADNYPLPILNSYDVEFGGTSANTTEGYVFFDWLDGTPLGGSSGFIITATVTNTTVNADGVAWTNLYAAATLPVTIVNMPPEILTRPGTNEVRKAAYEPFTIPFTVQDVPADLADPGLKATWTTSEGESVTERLRATGVGKYVVYNGTSPTFSFKSAGSKDVTLLVEDKDGGYDQRTWRYYVMPSKEVRIYPRNPAKGKTSAFTSYYTGAAGLGEGRVWSDGAVADFTDFIHRYTFDPTEASANVYAHGYKALETDDGTLLPEKDIRIDANGSYHKNGIYASSYTSRDIKGRDSFFYCWIMNTKGEGAGGYEGSLLTFDPAIEEKNGRKHKGQQLVTLPEYEEDLESYDPTVVDAIFSKELYIADNVGDINQDGIPDVYAVDRTYDGGKLYEFATGVAAGGGGEGGGDTATPGADLKPKLTAFNDDGDYLPADSMTSGNILITADSWTTVGQPFTAELEIRGFNSNLNYRVDSDGLNYNVIGKWVSDPAFSPAESNAIVRVNKERGIHDFVWPLPDPTNTAYAAAVQNWNEGLNKDLCWIPENRTDPTLDDTDADGFPDGYEYYFWYMSTVGWLDDKGNVKRLEGEKFTLDNIAKGVPLSPDEIAAAFNPTVAAGLLDASKRDTDADGLTDLEELAAGTNPVHWDSDGDGMSDLWEIMRGLDPLKKDAGANPDGDFMALVDLKEDYAILTFTTNKVTEFWAVPNNGYGFVDAEKSVILEAATGTVSGVKVYRYGNDDSPWTPINHPALEKEWAGGKPVPEADKMDKLDLDAVIKANGFAEDDGGDEGQEGGEGGDSARYAALKESVTAITNQHLRLVHDQVYAQYGYDPRTAWNKNKEGYVADRWNVSKSSAKYAGETGKAMNTAPFTALHEYLLLKYRYNTRPLHAKENPADSADRTYSASRDKSNVRSGRMTMADVLALGTTNPNAPYEGKTYGNLGASASGSGSGSEEGGTNTTSAATYSNTNHGADTDNDGVPDGWELYVGHNPNTGSADDLDDKDDDHLGLVAEYAGTDSCDAYAFATNGNGAVTIYANHTGVAKGWYNKFFPTDPWNSDTDGDGLDDNEEGNTWRGTFRYGNVGSEDVHTHTYTFIYGPNEGKPEKDDGTICIRGGGLNPCTVDTDGDMLPDPWEHDFAGVVFNADGMPDKINIDEGLIRLIRRSDGLKADAKAVQPYITAGMDGTQGWRMEDSVQTGDAYTSSRYTDPFTGTKRNYDFDHDGLQNFQEYLVQSLRHLRYDDKDTPLLGQWMPDGTPNSRQFFAFVPMNIMDGETFYAKAKAAGFPATGAWKFNEIGYFARPAHAWDLTAQNTYSEKKVNYDEYGYRVMLRPQFRMGSTLVKAASYCSTDPRMFDTDQDGMDDYYEIFHGLNPLLGSVGDPSEGAIVNDVIAQAYQGNICWWSNAWTGWPMMSPFGDSNSPYDAMKYPWAMGTPQADADGDGIVNSDEALLVNLATPTPAHTDPTPLWMTDSTSPGMASYTVQYYQMDPDALTPDFAGGAYPWNWDSSGDLAAAQKSWMFSFEENEGYDTDHDGLNDLSESTTTAMVASDPINFTDPDRRQALWFPGENSAAVSFNSSFRRELDIEYSFLKRFTVEAWVCPEAIGRDQVIIERAVNCTPDTLSNNVARIRANFRIGLLADGRLYGQFDTTDAIETGSGDSSPKVVSVFTQEAGKWTHVALSYNGSELTLYVDGAVAGTFATALVPANGIVVLAQDAVPDSVFPVLRKGYEVQDSAVVLGARAVAKSALKLKPATELDMTTWADYDSFYAGYIDEVRVWDDARTSVQIVESMNKRFSLADAKALREEVYASWVRGGTRNDNDGYPNLPAELVLHYNFQTLYGAADATDVAHEPVGFTKNVIDNVRVDGDYVPGGLFCGWWYGLKDTVGSTVYRNYNVVPWIPNTCAHLPPFDGSAGDSWYWSEYLGGVAYASEVLPELDITSTTSEQKFQFPNSATPYPYQNYVGDRTYHRNAIGMLAAVDPACSELDRRCRFDARTGWVGCSDLVPLGGAFAKRAAEMWDGDGAATAWELAGWDDDSDGIPDWWEAVAIASYGAPADFTWDSQVVHSGVTMTAREAYLRDLASGMMPDGSVNTAYRTQTDTNNNGLPDWWENLYGVTSAAEDTDGDGLSNYAEYLIGECFVSYGFPRISPSMPHSLGQAVPDYFLRVGSLYLGEMFTDHDMIEDLWEDQFNVDAVSRYVWDANRDPDDDGWSNFAEARADTDPSRQIVNAIDDFTVAHFPVPTIDATVVYNGQDTLNYPIIVEAYSKNSGVAGIPDAVWATGSSESLTKYLGLNPNKSMKITLGPGAVKPGTVKVYFKDPNWMSGPATNRTYGTLETAQWDGIVEDRVRTGSTVVGNLMSKSTNTSSENVGLVNYETGEFTLDFTALQAIVQVSAATSSSGSSSGTSGNRLIHLATSYVYVEWQSAVPSGNSRITLSLADSLPNSDTFKSRGHVREGQNMFVAFLDKNGDNKWTPGEPYGVAKGVDVGWAGASFAVELTDTAAETFRIDLASAFASNDFDSQRGLNDRGVLGYPGGKNLATLPGEDMPSATENAVRLRVVRTNINGLFRSSGNSTYATETVFDTVVRPGDNPFFTERNILEAAADLDWSSLVTRATAMGIATASITNATYCLVVGDGSVSATTTNNWVATRFQNVFESGAAGAQTKCVPRSPKGSVYSGQPTFEWMHPNPLGKPYPAFRLRVWDAAGSTVVYDSGVQPAPARNSKGEYSWTAPIYADTPTPKGVVFATTNNYQWSVSMLDAKFTAVNSSETKQGFRLEASGALGTISDYGTIYARVKYFGPGSCTASLSKGIEKIIRVQAFTTPDFSGVPAGEGWVTSVAKRADPDVMSVNAVIRGVPPGTYYVRAFIDTDGDCTKDTWESWGYGCYVGAADAPYANVLRGGDLTVSAADFPYTPRGYVVTVGADSPVADIYIEDADTDNDGLPDVYEMETYSALGSTTSPKGNTFFTKVNPSLNATVNAYTRLGAKAGSGSTTYAVMTLMNTLLSESDPGATASAAALLSAAPESAVAAESTVVTIKSFSLEDGAEIAVETAVPAAASGQSVVITADEANVDLYLSCASAVDFADAVEVKVKSFTIRANDTTTMKVSADELSAAKARAPEAKFFKAIIR